jgi:hypothetical protein
MIKYLKEKNIHDRMFVMLFVYTIGQCIIPLNRLGGSVICMIAVLYIIKGIYEFKGKIYNPYQANIKILFNIYVLMTIFLVIIRGYFSGVPLWDDYFGILSYHFAAPLFYLAFLLPLFVYIDNRTFNFNILIKIAPWAILLGVILLVIFRSHFFDIKMGADIQDSIAFSTRISIVDLLSFPAFLLLLYPYFHNKKIWYLILIATIICLYLQLIHGRRGGVMSCLMVIVAGLYFRFKSNKSKFNAILFSVALLIFGVNTVLVNKMTYFRVFFERLDSDSRSSVNKYFINDMFQSSDFFWGRGIMGVYNSPGFETMNAEGTIVAQNHRHSIETGFFHLILKGGIVFALIYVFILLKAAFLGFFKSNNLLTKALAIWIFLSLIELYPFGWPAFNTRYFIIWMGSVICLSKFYRKMNDDEIYKLLIK